ncbi:hypothetical protein QD460_31230 [Rhizobium jaguaris]
MGDAGAEGLSIFRADSYRFVAFHDDLDVELLRDAGETAARIP